MYRSQKESGKVKSEQAKLKSVAVLLNPKKRDAVPLACELVSWLESKGVYVMAEHEAALAMGMPGLSRDESSLVKADFALIMGGDGTLLRASHIMAPAGVPMLAIRFGRFGFLTDTAPRDARHALEQVLCGSYTIDERMMLTATIYRGQEEISASGALNDMVIAKGPLSRMLRLATSVSGKYVSTYSADGLIVATPTGSTAYSLSAGGPLVSPDIQVIIITPICPHTLNARSLIISSKQAVEVVVEGETADIVMLTVDGQRGIPLNPADKISIKQWEHKARLITVHKTGFFDKLQTRLRWGDRFDS
jgi:NAD+ kinase